MRHPDTQANGADVAAEVDSESTVVVDTITWLNRQTEQLDSLEAELEHDAASARTVDRNLANIASVERNVEDVNV